MEETHGLLITENFDAAQNKKKISYINAHLWNLEKWYRWTYFQGRNRDADTEKGPVGGVGDGGESGDWLPALLCIKQAAGGNLLISTGCSAWFPVMTQMGGIQGWEGGPEGGCICIHIADSCTCAAETNNIVKQFYPNLKK